ncbi:MAG: two-component regulator propeller domain-containing protein [Bacteroidia bacterium]
MKYFFSFCFILLLLNNLFVSAQTKPPTLGWRVHLPYLKNNTIDVVENKVYCGSETGIFTYDINAREVERQSRVNGLSDVEVTLLRHFKPLNVTIILYANSNIDLIYHSTNTVVNLPDILNRQIIGRKALNNVDFFNNRAYLATSFGIVVIDLVSRRIVDSYQNLGPGGTNLEFSDVCILNNIIYAVANNALYAVSLNAQNLNDFNFWTNIKSSSRSRFCAKYGSNLLVEIDSNLQVYDGITFTPFTPTEGERIVNLNRSGNRLFAVTENKIVLVEPDLSIKNYNQTFKNGAAIDAKGRLCMIDNLYGLTIDLGNGETDFIMPNGPTDKTTGKFTYAFGRLWHTGGQVNEKFDETYNNSKFNTFKNNVWRNFWLNNNQKLYDARDFLDIKKHPFADRIFISSYGTGIFELDGENFIELYDEKNSSMQRFGVPGFNPLRVSGIDFDNAGNLWVSNFGVSKPLSVKTNSGWQSFSVGSLVSNSEVGYLTCDDNNNVWLQCIRDIGILVYNHNGTPDNPNDDQFKLITKEVGQGSLPHNKVNAITKDLNGEIWIGTNEGLAIISNPGLVFNTQNRSFDARQIIIKTGDYFSVFLGTEVINCIKVDPANRKWIGTRNGVWLVSPDGYTVIHNFTRTNSPLLSNNVLEIGIDEETGEVFFATDKGIISFMGTSTAAENKFGKVEIYPNPVKPDYTGLISIKGLANNATVKIADINGNLVYETTANGGFATWDGTSFGKRRVATGVYLIFSSNRDGSETHVGKILFIN